ncbi:MAG: hypothetical protein ACREGC_00645 [Minisyncoccia bacterium]
MKFLKRFAGLVNILANVLERIIVGIFGLFLIVLAYKVGTFLFLVLGESMVRAAPVALAIPTFLVILGVGCVMAALQKEEKKEEIC